MRSYKMIEMDMKNNWTSAQYQKDPEDTVCGIMAVSSSGENVFIPISVENVDYVEIKNRHDDAEDSFKIKDAD